MGRCGPWSSTPPAGRFRSTLTRPRAGPAPAAPAWGGPRAGGAVVAVRACGVCRTALHILDGEVRGGRYPIVPGHQVVGTVLETGDGTDVEPGARIRIPGLGGAAGAS